MPLVSMIVPVYNVEAYLSDCIESILRQSLSDFELILVDDCSPDRCGAICDDYATRDERIRVIHQKNGGVSNARNTGLEQASGRYIAFCDSDDTLHQDFLSTLVNAMEKSEVDSVVSSFDRVFPDGKVSPGRSIDNGYYLFHSIQEKANYISQQILCKRVGWEVCTRIFRRNIIEQHHIRFCESCDNFAEDLGFVLQFTFFSAGEAAVDYHGYRYFQRSGSMMNSSKDSLKIHQTNQVSKYVYPSFCEAFISVKSRRIFTLFHTEMLYEQLRFVPVPDLQLAIAALSEVQDRAFLKKHLKGICRYYSKLKKLCGKRQACRMILLAHFIRFQSPLRFRLERSILNRFIVCVD